MNRTAVTAALTLTAAAGLLVAGPLTPPAGPVASSYKTLSEVEPRIAINAVNTPGDANSVYRITQPGSYYLTGNVLGQAGKHGIEVVADRVSIDLAGFEVRGVAGALSGITDTQDELLPTKVMVVRNGTISGFPGGQVLSEWCADGRFEGLTLSGPSSAIAFTGVAMVVRCSAAGNGGGSIGYALQGGGSMVERCSARGYGSGFHMTEGTVRECVAEGCTTGVDISNGLADRCLARGCTTGIGLNSACAQACTVDGAGIGIEAGSYDDTVRGCTVSGASTAGIRVTLGRVHVVENIVTGTTGTGVAIQAVPGAVKGHIEGNIGSNNASGILVMGTEFTVIRNSFCASVAGSANYHIYAGNRFGTIVHTGTSAGAVSSNASTATLSGTLTASDPFANLSY